MVAGENEAKMGQPGGVKYEVMLRAHELPKGLGVAGLWKYLRSTLEHQGKQDHLP